MKCAISNVGVHAFGKAVHCLAKIGEEIFIETRINGLSFKTVNSARSAYACFEFNKYFFDSFESGLSSNDGDAVSCCKIMTKSFLLIFRALSSLEKTVQQCFISCDLESFKITVTCHCKHGIIKRHQIGCNECEMLKAVYNKESCFNQIGGASRPLNEVVINFPNSLDEVTLVSKKDRIHLKNYVEDFEDNRGPLTEVCLTSEEFDTFLITEEASVTFCLKELRAILVFTESLGDNLTINFESCGKPVVLTVDDNPQYTADIVLASLIDDRSHETTCSNNSTHSGGTQAMSSITKTARHYTKENMHLPSHSKTDSDCLSDSPTRSIRDQSNITYCEPSRVMDSLLLTDESQLHETTNIKSYRPIHHSFTDQESFQYQEPETMTQQLSDEISCQEDTLPGFVPSTPPPAKKFKSLFSVHDMFGGQQVTDSILALDSEEED